MDAERGGQLAQRPGRIGASRACAHATIIPANRLGCYLMVQDIPCPGDPTGPGSGGENGPEAPQVDDESLSSDTKGGLYCAPA